MPAFPHFLLWSTLTGRVRCRPYHDGGLLRQFNIRVNRLENETQLTLLFPNNPIAHESVAHYVAVFKSIMVRIAEGREVMPAPRRNGRLHLAHSRHALREVAKGKF